MRRRSPIPITVQILIPSAEQVFNPELRPLAPRLTDLRGKTIGMVYNTFVSIRIINDELRRLLEPYDLKVITMDRKFWRPLHPRQLDELAEHADAVIDGLCNTPPSSRAGVHDSVELEKRGRPTVTFATAYYEDIVAALAGTEGMPDLRRIILPYPLEGQPAETVKAVARLALVPLVAALTDPASEIIASV